MRNLRPRSAGFKNCGRRLAGSKTCSIAVRLGVVRTARLGNAAPQPARVPASRSGHGSTPRVERVSECPRKADLSGSLPETDVRRERQLEGIAMAKWEGIYRGKQRLDRFHVSTPPAFLSDCEV